LKVVQKLFLEPSVSPLKRGFLEKTKFEQFKYAHNRLSYFTETVVTFFYKT